MKTTQRLTGLALATLLTVAMLGGIDRLAHDEFTTASSQTLAQTLAHAAPAGATRL